MARVLHLTVDFASTVSKGQVIARLEPSLTTFQEKLQGSLGKYIPLMALSFGFSALVGVGFGLYPARKAARLDPIEALRYG